jgi:DNA polymerase I-like protein with 3'-5' exonuclease and polymerase domains
MAKKFLQGFIVDFSHRGRIHAEIHSYRSDDGGTRSYRFSYSNPPLQQMPSRTEAGRLVRTVFLPEDGELWLSSDYSQQEPRLTVHYAYECGIRGSAEAVDYYRYNPNPDYHSMVAEMFGQPRKRAKIINLGLAYGMGVEKLADGLDLPLDEAKKLLDEYNERVPFVGGLSKHARQRADQRGYIKLIDGARCRFDMWELSWREKGDGWSPALPLEAAREKWPDRRLRRAFTSKALNRLIQGSAARQTKLAMRQCWREGIVPLIQMHDELCNSVREPAQVARITEIMETVIKLQVPSKADSKIGLNWGSVRECPPARAAHRVAALPRLNLGRARREAGSASEGVPATLVAEGV